MVFGITKLRKLSMGNRVAYHYKITDASNAGTSILRTPFKKILGVIPTTTSQIGDHISFVATEGVPGTPAYLTMNCDTDNSDGEVIVWGLL